jgi:hypothetical protein
MEVGKVSQIVRSSCCTCVLQLFCFLQLPFVSAVLLSEFDIDKGSTLRACVPEGAVKDDPSVVASLMLPEGAHHREHDWTVFILNREVR